jgi:hypothetical protein
MSGYIDNYATEGNPVVDITGTPLGFLINFVAKGATAPQDISVLSFANALNLSQALVTELQTPLSQIGDQVWSQDKDANGKTMRDRASATIVTQLSSSVTKALGSGFSAYNISTNLPATGILRSIVVGENIFLSYELIGVGVSFSLTTPITGGPISDPNFTATFDAELLIIITIPPSPGQFNLTSTVNIENANVSPLGPIAGLAVIGLQVFQFIMGQPNNFFEEATGQIDSSGGIITANVGPFSAMLAQLSSAWQQAIPYGFRQATAFIDQNARALNVRLTHPVDPAPVPVNAADPTYPSLFQPSLGTSTSCVEPGGSLNVTGTNFPIGQANDLYIGWQDTTSGNVTQSDITWGPAGDPMHPTGGPMQTVTKTRNPSDDGNSLALTNLVPNTAYLVAIRDQDLLTETAFTQPAITISTQITDIVHILLEYGATQWSVGSGQLTATGTFTTTVDIPADLTPGTYSLKAVLGGTEIKATDIEVASACKTRIEVIDPTSNTVQTGVVETYSFTLRGDGFEAGTVNIYIDSISGAFLGSAVIANGTSFQKEFIWPTGSVGTHSIVAQETVGSQALEVNTTVTADAQPS